MCRSWGLSFWVSSITSGCWVEDSVLVVKWRGAGFVSWKDLRAWEVSPLRLLVRTQRHRQDRVWFHPFNGHQLILLELNAGREASLDCVCYLCSKTLGFCFLFFIFFNEPQPMPFHHRFVLSHLWSPFCVQPRGWALYAQCSLTQRKSI